jgi:pimeloyl-ACP methyl ester carboxylesterase
MTGSADGRARQHGTAPPGVTSQSRLPRGDGGILYESSGSCDVALVLVHGAFTDHHDWDDQIASLSERWRVVAIDLPGHGGSTRWPEHCSVEDAAEDVLAVVRHLSLRHAVLVGHSFGCRVVLETYRRMPTAWLGIVLVDGSCFPSRDVAPFGSGHGPTATARREALLNQMFGPSTPTSVRSRVRELGAGVNEQVASAIMSSSNRWDDQVVDALATVRVPVLAVQSTFTDPSTPRHCLARGDSSPWLELLQRTVRADVRIVPGVGHYSMLEDPATVTRAIDDFATACSRQRRQDPEVR